MSFIDIITISFFLLILIYFTMMFKRLLFVFRENQDMTNIKAMAMIGIMQIISLGLLVANIVLILL